MLALSIGSPISRRGNQQSLSALLKSIVSGLLIELAGAVHDVRLVDLLGPVVRFDFLDRHRDSVITHVSDCRNIFDDRLREAGFLLLRSAGVHLYDDMGHRWCRSLHFATSARYSSSLTCSSQSTSFPSSSSWMAMWL